MCEWLSLEVPFCKRGWQCVIERSLRGQIEWPDFQYLYLFNKCYDHDWVICLDPSSFYPFSPPPQLRTWASPKNRRLAQAASLTSPCKYPCVFENQPKACLEWLLSGFSGRRGIYFYKLHFVSISRLTCCSRLYSVNDHNALVTCFILCFAACQ